MSRLTVFFVCLLIIAACKKSADSPTPNSNNITPPTPPSTPTPQAGVVWQKALGGTSEEELISCAPTADGGCVMIGVSDSNDGDVSGNHGSSDVWVVKLNSSGDISWQKTLGGSKDDIGYSIIATSDGGYAALGYTKSTDGDFGPGSQANDLNVELWVVKLNSAGSIMWQKTFTGSSGEFGRSIVETSDGNLVIVGHTYSNDGDFIHPTNGYSDVFIIKLNSSGGVIWKKIVGGSQIDQLYSIVATPDGGAISVGFSKSNDGDVSGNHGSYDFWVVKINNAGNISWQKSFGGLDIEAAASIARTNDGGYIVCGDTRSNSGDVSGNRGETDGWIIKIDEQGALQWQKTFGGTETESFVSTVVNSQGQIVAAGTSRSKNGDIAQNNGGLDFWVVQLDANGNLLRKKNFGGSADDIAMGFINSLDGNYIVMGRTSSNNGDVSGHHGGYADGWVVKFKFQ